MSEPLQVTLRRLRLERGLSQERLAKEILVTQKMVCNWEIGKRRPYWGNVVRWARFFGFDVEETAEGERRLVPR